MTQPPPPYGPHPTGPGPARPPKRRPSAGWFAVGIALIRFAVVVAVALFLTTLGGFLRTDARIDADGVAHQIRVDGGKRMLWVEDGLGQRCEIVDRSSGEPIPLDPVSGDLRRSSGAHDWSGFARFDPGSGDLEITCAAGEGSVLIGPSPRIASFVLGILATILVPLALFLAGVAVLLTTGILWSVRPARTR